MNKADVKRLQAGLNSAGYDSGLLDGILGPITLSAAVTYLYKEFGETGVAEDALARLKTKPTTTMIPGIDVSAYNGDIDWEAVAGAGIKYMWCKQSEGTTHHNGRRKENLAGARSVGIKTGGYHFARPDTYQSLQLGDAVNEGHNFLNCYDHKPGDLVPALDLESGLLKNDHNYNLEWIFEWCHTVEKELGLKPKSILMYSARWACVSRLLKGDAALKKELAEYRQWWCEYRSEQVTAPTKNPAPWKPNDWVVWQWTGHGKVPGCKGRVDRNHMKPGGLEQLRMDA